MLSLLRAGSSPYPNARSMHGISLRKHRQPTSQHPHAILWLFDQLGPIRGSDPTVGAARHPSSRAAQRDWWLPANGRTASLRLHRQAHAAPPQPASRSRFGTTGWTAEIDHAAVIVPRSSKLDFRIIPPSFLRSLSPRNRRAAIHRPPHPHARGKRNRVAPTPAPAPDNPVRLPGHEAGQHGFAVLGNRVESCQAPVPHKASCHPSGCRKAGRHRHRSCLPPTMRI